MLIKNIIAAATLLLFFSCSGGKNEKPATAMDAGRNFIRATLDGDFNAAEVLLLKDDRNTAMFASYKEFYTRLPAEKKQAYKKAFYNINTYKDLDDSVSLINYSNTYMNQPMNIKLVKKDQLWQVDFKYTSEDSTAN